MDASPAKRHVRIGDLPADDKHLQRDGDHEPGDADCEKADEA